MTPAPTPATVRGAELEVVPSWRPLVRGRWHGAAADPRSWWAWPVAAELGQDRWGLGDLTGPPGPDERHPRDLVDVAGGAPTSCVIDAGIEWHGHRWTAWSPQPGVTLDWAVVSHPEQPRAAVLVGLTLAPSSLGPVAYGAATLWQAHPGTRCGPAAPATGPALAAEQLRGSARLGLGDAAEVGESVVLLLDDDPRNSIVLAGRPGGVRGAEITAVTGRHVPAGRLRSTMTAVLGPPSELADLHEDLRRLAGGRLAAPTSR